MNWGRFLNKKKSGDSRSLYIIGNGFDRSNDLKTSYEDFHQYLKKRFPGAREDKYDLSNVVIKQEGRFSPDNDGNVSIMLRMLSLSEAKYQGKDFKLVEIDDLEWNHLEEAMGQLSYEEILQPIRDHLSEEEIEWLEKYNNWGAVLAKIPFANLNKYLCDWVSEIDKSNLAVRQKFKDMIREKDLFLSFNYTDTLETSYGVKEENVCHIHGKSGEKLYFGHGENGAALDKIEQKYPGANGQIDSLSGILEKDTRETTEKHQDFFDKISKDITYVYSYGFSYGEVDLVYIREICKRIPRNCIWYIHNYDTDKVKIYTQKLRRCGFKGKIQLFSD